jgi:hypothetical protein
VKVGAAEVENLSRRPAPDPLPPQAGRQDVHLRSRGIDYLKRGPEPEAKANSEAAAATVEVEAHTRNELKLRLFGRAQTSGKVIEHNEDNFVVADPDEGGRGLIGR